MGKRIVIIGGVAAGPKAACRVKRLLPDAEVTIIDQDSLISYGGCGIPYYISGDVADEKELRSTSFHMLRDESFFSKTKGVSTLTSTRALAIDRKNKTVAILDLKSGVKDHIAYDFLLIATGSQPVALPIPGNAADGVFTISDLHKAIAIKDRMAKGQVGKAVVIGGGAIGIEMAEAFTDLWGVETAIVEFKEQLLPRIIDWPLAVILEKQLRDHNVAVYLGEAAEEIVVEQGKAIAVRTSKRTLEADLVIMAAGVRPRSDHLIHRHTFHQFRYGRGFQHRPFRVLDVVPDGQQHARRGRVIRPHRRRRLRRTFNHADHVGQGNRRRVLRQLVAAGSPARYRNEAGALELQQNLHQEPRRIAGHS